MRKISPQVKEKILQSGLNKQCARKDSSCAGAITWEHVLTYAGKQIDEAWCIIGLCEFHHSVGKYQDSGDLNKEINTLIALNRATDAELLKYSKAIDYIKLRERLNTKYGKRD